MSSLDDKYRPRVYSDVLGQDGTVQILKEIVKQGRGFRQSYVFAGEYGSGKTTQARILARALLCENPQEGEPCDECTSCKIMLDPSREHDDFIEVDAANHSKKEDIARIVEDLQYATFSGRQKVYIFDESHELSKSAMDALLLPMENTRPGSEDKMICCIFCTTEPAKMRAAILSRCAPVFKIKINTPEVIADRLGQICENEGLEFELPALKLIAEVTECHIRDCLKAVEGVSMLGSITEDRVRSYLQLDANTLYLDLLESLGTDIEKALGAAVRATEKVSPALCYERMAELSMMAYRLAHLGSANVPSFWDKDRLQAVAESHREFLIQFAQAFGSRPAHANTSMFLCDVSALHQKRAGIVVRAQSQQEVVVPTSVPEGTPVEVSVKTDTAQKVKVEDQKPQNSGTMEPVTTSLGVYVDPRAQNSDPRHATISTSSRIPPLPAAEFSAILHRRVLELVEGSHGGSTRWNNMGSP